MTFAAPNYTQVPNSFFGEPYAKEGPQPGMIAELGLAETKVACVVMRATFGYHRPNARISYSKMSLLAGLSQSSVYEAATTLNDNQIIRSWSDGGVTVWEPVMDEEEWSVDLEVAPVSKPKPKAQPKPVEDEPAKDEFAHFTLDTLDQMPYFLTLNLSKRASVTFDCTYCGIPDAITEKDEIAPCCHAVIHWKNNPLWDKHQKQKAADAEAKRRNALAQNNLSAGAKHLLNKAIGTDPQGKCQFKPGEAARVAAFEEEEGLEYVQSVVNRKVAEGHKSRGLIISVLNSLPCSTSFAAKDFEDEDEPEEEQDDGEVVDVSRHIKKDWDV